MKGEALASGSEHADNVAPSIYGGFTLITSYTPLNIVSLPVPENLFVTIIRPHIEIKTKESRAALPTNVPLKNAITQSGNLAGFISSLYTSDYELMARSLDDVLVEPQRKDQLPLFDKSTVVKKTFEQTLRARSLEEKKKKVASQKQSRYNIISRQKNRFSKQKMRGR